MTNAAKQHREFSRCTEPLCHVYVDERAQSICSPTTFQTAEVKNKVRTLRAVLALPQAWEPQQALYLEGSNKYPDIWVCQPRHCHSPRASLKVVDEIYSHDVGAPRGGAKIRRLNYFKTNP